MNLCLKSMPRHSWTLVFLIANAPVAWTCAHATAPPRAEATPGESVEETLTRGRALLAQGKLDEAAKAFDDAALLDGSTIRTRMWVLRCWLAQGRVNDALDEIDKLEKAGNKGVAMDYLYGMAFAFKAQGYLEERAPGGIVDMAFQDASGYLKKATEADPLLCADAFRHLAQCAWHQQQLDVARAAGERAVGVAPGDFETRMILGRIAFSQYVVAKGDEAQKAALESHWEAARASFAKAAEIAAQSTDVSMRSKRAEAEIQLGDLLVWKQKPGEASSHYTQAMALNPALVNFAQVRGTLAPEVFIATLDAAVLRYAEVWGAANSGDATLQWWLGFARFGAKDYKGAETAFTTAVTKWPDFVNSWFYVGLARYHQQNYDGFVAALRKNWDANPSDLVNSLSANADEYLFYLDYAVGIVMKTTRNSDAAFLSEVQSAVNPKEPRYLNNLGLFLRDEGEALERVKRGKLNETEQAHVKDLYERAYVAYKAALDLSPDDPNYLNDTALMLHLHLDRDLEQAKAWYTKGIECAKRELERKDLKAELVDLRKIALRDNTNNLRDLTALLEARAKKAAGGG